MDQYWGLQVGVENENAEISHEHCSHYAYCPLQDPCQLAVMGVVKTDQLDISDWPVSLLNCHLPDNGLAKVNIKVETINKHIL